jgi:hypothetical protein
MILFVFYSFTIEQEAGNKGVDHFVKFSLQNFKQIKNPVTQMNYWVLLWGLTGSNRRPSACKADALNQLS